MNKILVRELTGGTDKASAIAAYRRNNEKVRDTIPVCCDLFQIVRDSPEKMNPVDRFHIFSTVWVVVVPDQFELVPGCPECTNLK